MQESRTRDEDHEELVAGTTRGKVEAHAGARRGSAKDRAGATPLGGLTGSRRAGRTRQHRRRSGASRRRLQRKPRRGVGGQWHKRDREGVLRKARTYSGQSRKRRCCTSVVREEPGQQCQVIARRRCRAVQQITRERTLELASRLYVSRDMMYVGSTLAMMMAGRTVTMKMATGKVQAGVSQQQRFEQRKGGRLEAKRTSSVLHVLGRGTEVEESKRGNDRDSAVREQAGVAVLEVSQTGEVSQMLGKRAQEPNSRRPSGRRPASCAYCRGKRKNGSV